MQKFILLLVIAFSSCVTFALDETPPHAEVKPLLQKDFKELDGKQGVMLLVTFAPGSVDAIHRHNAHAFIYVLEGSIDMQLKGQELVTLKAGETFYESPSDIHVVGKNTSKTEQAKFLVFFVKNKGADVVIPVK